jgi:hypothetical protein
MFAPVLVSYSYFEKDAIQVRTGLNEMWRLTKRRYRHQISSSGPTQHQPDHHQQLRFLMQQLARDNRELNRVLQRWTATVVSARLQGNSGLSVNLISWAVQPIGACPFCLQQLGANRPHATHKETATMSSSLPRAACASGLHTKQRRGTTTLPV